MVSMEEVSSKRQRTNYIAEDQMKESLSETEAMEEAIRVIPRVTREASDVDKIVGIALPSYSSCSTIEDFREVFEKFITAYCKGLEDCESGLKAAEGYLHANFKTNDETPFKGEAVIECSRLLNSLSSHIATAKAKIEQMRAFAQKFCDEMQQRAADAEKLNSLYFDTVKLMSELDGAMEMLECDEEIPPEENNYLMFRAQKFFESLPADMKQKKSINKQEHQFKELKPKLLRYCVEFDTAKPWKCAMCRQYTQGRSDHAGPLLGRLRDMDFLLILIREHLVLLATYERLGEDIPYFKLQKIVEKFQAHKFYTGV